MCENANKYCTDALRSRDSCVDACKRAPGHTFARHATCTVITAPGRAAAQTTTLASKLFEAGFMPAAAASILHYV